MKSPSRRAQRQSDTTDTKIPKIKEQTVNTASSSKSKQRNKSNKVSLSPLKIIGVIIVILVGLLSIINILASHILDDGILLNDGATADSSSNEMAKGIGKMTQKQFQNQGGDTVDKRKTLRKTAEKITQQQQAPLETPNSHSLGGLSCDSFGGPSEEVASEMVFWSDIKSDSLYKSHFYDENSIKYITFEPDHGGWNNIRMAMETVLVMAHAMGRTLVLPPKNGIYLLGKKGEENHNTEFTFQDFFHLDSIAVEHEGLNVISMEEFLRRKNAEGGLTDRETGEKVTQPTVNWDSQRLNPLWSYIRGHSYLPADWDPHTCIAAIPSESGQAAVDELEQAMADILKGDLPDIFLTYEDKPTDVDGPVVDRLKELTSKDRQRLCIYDTKMQEEPVIHFAYGEKTRLLSHFYAFVFFQDWKQDLWSKRFIRDHVRYIDVIMCAAARIVAAVRATAATNSPTQSTEYDSLHVRRGDFQFKETRLEAKELYAKSSDQLTEGATVYVATDERAKEFFDPLREHYKLAFLDDYLHLIKGVNPNYYGMLDQLVAYRGRVFYGTWFSTLSGYVNRMRGYASVKQKWEGYERGALPQSFYFSPADRKSEMVKYKGVRLPLYMREFPTSWRDIDRGIGEL